MPSKGKITARFPALPWSLLTQAALFGVWVAGTDFLARWAPADSADSLPCPSHTRFLGALANRVSCSTQPAWHQNHLAEPQPALFLSFFKFAFHSKFSISAVEAGTHVCFSKVVLNSRHGARANLGHYRAWSSLPVSPQRTLRPCLVLLEGTRISQDPQGWL